MLFGVECCHHPAIQVSPQMPGGREGFLRKHRVPPCQGPLSKGLGESWSQSHALEEHTLIPRRVSLSPLWTMLSYWPVAALWPWYKGSGGLQRPLGSHTPHLWRSLRHIVVATADRHYKQVVHGPMALPCLSGHSARRQSKLQKCCHLGAGSLPPPSPLNPSCPWLSAQQAWRFTWGRDQALPSWGLRTLDGPAKSSWALLHGRVHGPQAQDPGPSLLWRYESDTPPAAGQGRLPPGPLRPGLRAQGLTRVLAAARSFNQWGPHSDHQQKCPPFGGRTSNPAESTTGVLPGDSSLSRVSLLGAKTDSLPLSGCWKMSPRRWPRSRACLYPESFLRMLSQTELFKVSMISDYSNSLLKNDFHIFFFFTLKTMQANLFPFIFWSS